MLDSFIGVDPGMDRYLAGNLDLVQKIRSALKEPDKPCVRLKCFNEKEVKWFKGKFSTDEIERIQFVWYVFTKESAHSSDG